MKTKCNTYEECEFDMTNKKQKINNKYLGMKSIYKLLFLTLFLVGFISCQKEISQTIQPNQNDVLTANATITALVKSTVTNDGSKDNIIDNASCISIQFPFTVMVDGIEISIESEADYDAVETIFDEYADDDDQLDFVFPIVIILSDFTEISINDKDELEGFVNECGDENEMDDDIECIDLVYPISFSIFDSANQLAETVTVINDEQFYKFIEDLEDYKIVQINFPIKVLLYDGTEKIINDMNALENEIEQAKDSCNEDDNNDFDDDDCNDCTNEQISQLLLTCSWSVDELEIDGVEKTDNYADFLFTFLNDGTVKANNNGNIINGTWVIENTVNGILVKIKFNDLPDLSFNWMLSEIEDDNEIDLKFEDNRLKFEKKCD
ncbi:MAG: hypothetical protein Q7T92_04610 [Lutibacter sp.]|nr:hypothetical protein [Lutibacter sp.]